jgi:hypothetical protein
MWISHPVMFAPEAMYANPPPAVDAVIHLAGDLGAWRGDSPDPLHRPCSGGLVEICDSRCEDVR